METLSCARRGSSVVFLFTPNCAGLLTRTRILFCTASALLLPSALSGLSAALKLSIQLSTYYPFYPFYLFCKPPNFGRVSQWYNSRILDPESRWRYPEVACSTPFRGPSAVAWMALPGVRMNGIPKFVLEGMIAVSQYGCLNLYNPEAVIFWLWKAGYTRAAEWLEVNEDQYPDALAGMAKRVGGGNLLDGNQIGKSGF